MKEMRKLQALIPLWMNRNEEHMKEYRCWAEGTTEVSAELLEAVDAMRRVNQALGAVLKNWK